MTLKAFQKPSSLTPDLEVLARAINDYTQPLTKNPLLDGYLLEGVSLTTAAKAFPHNLNRPWNGFVITDKKSFADVISVSTPYDNKTITLQANATVTVDVWVF